MSDRVFDAARTRWLNAGEIMGLLAPETTPLSLSKSPPPTPPPSGSLLLYDRSETRRYKEDGHRWVRKRNSAKVREDHVKLRFNGKETVSGSYAHGADQRTLHRRAYRLMEGPNEHPFVQRRKQNWMLLHYLDTEEAARMSAFVVDRMVAASQRDGGNDNESDVSEVAVRGVDRRRVWPADTKSVRPTRKEDADGRDRGRDLDLTPRQERDGDGMLAASSDKAGSNNAKTTGEETSGEAERRRAWSEGGCQAGAVEHRGEENGDWSPHQIYMDWADESNSSIGAQRQSMEARSESSVRKDSFLDDHTLDLLWGTVVDHEDVADELHEAAAAAVQRHLTPAVEAELVTTVVDAIEDAVSTALEGQARSSSEAVEQVVHNELLAPEIEEKVVSTLEEKISAQLERKLVKTMEDNLQSGREPSSDPDSEEHEETVGAPPPSPQLPETPLPDVVDVTPHEAHTDVKKATQVVISMSTPVPALPPDDLPYRWHYLAAFVDLRSDGLFSGDGSFSALSPPPDSNAIPDNICTVENGSSEACPLDTKKAPEVSAAITVAPATVLTPFSYKCEVPPCVSQCGPRGIIMVGARYRESSGQPGWGALCLAIQMTLQAEGLVAADGASDKLGDSSKNLQPTFYAPAGGHTIQLLSQLSGDVFYFRDELETFPEETRADTRSVCSATSCRSADRLPAPAPAMATVADALATFTDNPPPRAVRGKRVRGEEAGDWVASRAPDSDETLGESVDRHCKVRFVERLTTVVAKADEDARPDVSEGEIALDDEQLREIDDDVLDSLLDNALISFVEMLLNNFSDEEELRAQIDAAGHSGFALVHYAALYNMTTLLPLLITHGANLNQMTTKGGLTALHLACGAGNDQIAVLLVRSGCRVDARDSFGLTPADHALQNGFPEIAKWLNDACPGGSNASTKGSLGLNPNEARPLDERDGLLQSAFRGLSLKDKLGLKLFARRYRTASGAVTTEGQSAGGNDQQLGSGNSNTKLPMPVDGRDVKGEEHPPRLDFITEKDMQGLRVAMSLMSRPEREELERRASYSDVRNWMLRSNYESLREASSQLEREAKRKAVALRMTGRSSLCGGGSASAEKGRLLSAGTAKLSQALAMLVLRKNLIPGAKAQLEIVGV